MPRSRRTSCPPPACRRRSCAATTRSCAWPTSWAAPSSAFWTCRRCCRRSSTSPSNCCPRIATNAFTERDLQLFSSIANQAAVAIQNARLARKIEAETTARAQLTRLLPANVVEQVVSGQLKLDQKGELREVTMLFADIRG